MKKTAPASEKAAQTVVSVPHSEKPSTLKWAKGLAIFQITVGAVGAVFLIWLFHLAGSSELLDGIRQGVLEGSGGSMSDFSGSSGVGYIVGVVLSGLFGSISTLVAISRRTKAWSIASLILLGLNGIGGPSLIPVVIFILMLQESSRRYLNLSK